MFPGGVRGEALLLRAFSRNGESTVRIHNPISRMYADIPISQLRTILLTLSGSKDEMMPGLSEFPIDRTVVSGRVSGIPAKRYRVILGEAWIDVWTTTAIPRNPQFERLISTAIGTVSKSSANLLSRIPGVPVYVEMNTSRFKKLPILRAKKLVMSSDGESDALQTGAFYLKAPLADLIFR